MAVTGFWPVYRNLKATLDYADNPDKTTLPEYLDEDLYAALRYAENDNKTDRQVFVCGINCSKQNAYAEMIAVERRFGLRGKVVGYHGIQSFREGEVTPEQAFEIGKETARRMWGDKYQVLVTVHLNTDNIHCHFVVNPVSFKDGTKFHNKIGDHKELRRVSDQICREYGLSVLENSEFYSKGKKKEYWAHKAGKKTHRDYLREDVEYCLSFATNPGEFESQLYALGYTLDPVRFSVKAKHWERSVRLANIGFTKERVNKQLRQNAENRYRLFTLEYKPPYRPKRFPLEDELRRLDFAIDHSYDAAAVLVDTVFYLVITVIRIGSACSRKGFERADRRLSLLAGAGHSHGFRSASKYRTISVGAFGIGVRAQQYQQPYPPSKIAGRTSREQGAAQGGFQTDEARKGTPAPCREDFGEVSAVI